MHKTRAATYAAMIAEKAVGRIILAHVGVFLRIEAWTAAGGGLTNTWKATITQRPEVHNVIEVESVTFAEIVSAGDLDDTPARPMTERASAALVNANPESYFFDTTTDILYVCLTGAADPNDQACFAGVTLKFCTGDPWEPGTAFVDSVTNHKYAPLICMAPSSSRSIEDAFIQSMTTGTAQLTLDNASGILDRVWRLYEWHFGRVEVLLGPSASDLTKFTTVFYGSTEDKTWTEDVATLHLVNALDPLDTAIVGAEFVASDFTNTRTYTGNGAYGYGYAGTESNVASFTISATGNINSSGAMDLIAAAGDYKPIAYAVLEGVEPVVVSYTDALSTKQTAILCLSDNGYTAGTVSVYIDGSSAGVAWWRCDADGYLAVMLVPTVAGAARSITGKITVYFTAVGTNACENTLEDMADRVNALADLSVNDVVFNAASLTASTAVAADMPQVYIKEPTPFREVLKAMAYFLNAMVYANNDGETCFEIYVPHTDNEVAIYEEDFLSPPEVRESGARLYRKIATRYGYNVPHEIRIKPFYESIQSYGESAGLLAGRAIDYLIEGRADGVPDIENVSYCARRLARRTCRGVPIWSFRMVAKAFDLELMTRVAITRNRTPSAAQGDTIHGYVSFLRPDMATMEVDVEVTENLIAYLDTAEW